MTEPSESQQKELDPWYEYSDPPLTGQPCVKCGNKSGIDCPGRRPNEGTLCIDCFRLAMLKDYVAQCEHMDQYLQDRLLTEAEAEVVLQIIENVEWDEYDLSLAQQNMGDGIFRKLNMER